MQLRCAANAIMNQDSSLGFGNAIDLPFSDSSFDAVISIEASHRYPSFETFLREVRRVLRPGGHFMFADMRWDENGKLAMLGGIEQSGMSLSA